MSFNIIHPLLIRVNLPFLKLTSFWLILNKLHSDSGDLTFWGIIQKFVLDLKNITNENRYIDETDNNFQIRCSQRKGIGAV